MDRKHRSGGQPGTPSCAHSGTANWLGSGADGPQDRGRSEIRYESLFSRRYALEHAPGSRGDSWARSRPVLRPASGWPTANLTDVKTSAQAAPIRTQVRYVDIMVAPTKVGTHVGNSPSTPVILVGESPGCAKKNVVELIVERDCGLSTMAALASVRPSSGGTNGVLHIGLSPQTGAAAEFSIPLGNVGLEDGVLQWRFARKDAKTLGNAAFQRTERKGGQ